MIRILDRTWNPDEPSCNLVFLSARPHIFKHYSEDVSYGKLKQLVEDERLHSMPTPLPGELTSGLLAITRYLCRGIRAWTKVGKKKLNTYQNFRALHLEYDFVFFGDNGQGDLWAGEMMDVEQRSDPVSPKDGPQLVGVCIHQVIPEELSLCSSAEPVEGRLVESFTSSALADILDDPVSMSADGGSMSLHRTYGGAALHLRLRHPTLVRAADVRTVCRDAVNEFDKMRLVYAEWGSRWETAEEDLHADLEDARRVLDLATDDDEEFPELEEKAEILKRNALGACVFVPAKPLVRSDSLYSAAPAVNPLQNAIPLLGRSRSGTPSKPSKQTPAMTATSSVISSRRRKEIPEIFRYAADVDYVVVTDECR